ncbi:MAG: PIG-L family deacetylase [Moraxellaceae bacterium]|nr:MAG: PIG-L family deacetylase [Moraxellaceae bacterium]
MDVITTDALVGTTLNNDILVDERVQDRVIYGAGTSKQTWLNWPGLHQLSNLELAQHFHANQRVVIIAPHPDDEILGCAGLMQQLHELKRDMLLMAVTNGTQSHPESSIYSPVQLNHIRPQESLQALKVLGVQATVQRIALDIEDGTISLAQDKLYQLLGKHVQPNDILVCTFAKDGHPDHEATGNTVQRFANDQQLACYQVLIWAWHWASPNDGRIPWQQALKLELTAEQLALKKQAIDCFKSQIETDSSTQQQPILPSTAIERILMPYEVYLHG